MSSANGTDKAVLTAQLRESLVESKSYTDSLILQIIESTVSDITKIDATKADRLAGVSMTIPTTGWVDDKTGTYRYHYDLPINGITANDRVDVTVNVSSMDTAVACGLCPTTETINGALRLRSAIIPTAAISATYWVHEAASATPSNNSIEEGD